MLTLITLEVAGCRSSMPPSVASFFLLHRMAPRRFSSFSKVCLSVCLLLVAISFIGYEL